MIIQIQTIDDFIECYQKANITESRIWWKQVAVDMRLVDNVIHQYGSDAMKAKYLDNYKPPKPRKIINV